MAREFELKYRCDGETLSRIAEAFPGLKPITMETTYYDTQDLKLSFHHWTLRRRMENGQVVCTFKSPADDGSRNEWEVPCGNIMTAIPQLCQNGAPWELLRCTAGGVYPFCGARFTRLAKTLTLEHATVELALDRGVLTGGGKELPFYEVEVELKSGAEQEALAFAEALAKQYGLIPEPKAKVVRARELALGNV